MNYVSKLIFVTLISTLALNSSFGQLTHTIELSLDPNTHLLSDPGTTDVYTRDTVFWKIKPGENILVFNIAGAGHPFNTSLPNPNNNYFWIKRRVGRGGPYNWKYKIIYRLKTDPTRREYDPKIAIKPNPNPFTTIDVIILLGFVVTSIISIVFYRKWRNADRLLKEGGQIKT